MKQFQLLILASIICTSITSVSLGAAKKKIFVVSSYHREYLWSQETQMGLAASMLKHKYLDNKKQGNQLSKKDFVQSSRAIVKKMWMDTKRKNSIAEIAQMTRKIVNTIHEFQPDIVLLGDDNASNYIGNQLLDSEIPVVFWGINGIPLKYGLLDSLKIPGHNITGVYQSGYLKESLELLKNLVPQAKTFAILACDSPTSRPKIKQIKALAEEGKLPLKLVDTLSTNSFSQFKKETLRLANRVDAFFVLNHDTIKDAKGNYVDMMTVGKWYLKNIRKPEASHEGQFVKEGMLCAASDAGYNQGYEAFEMAAKILKGADPSRMEVTAPRRGPLMVNQERADMLGISLVGDNKDKFEVIIKEALALKE